jgi:diguanylate cyclase (GGDEF)-like protein
LYRWKKWIDPTLDDPELEEKYNVAYLSENIALTRISLWVWQLTNIALIYMDYLIFGFGRMFWLMLGTRTAISIYFGWVIHQLSMITEVRRFERILFISMLIGVSVFLLINVNRPTTYLHHTVIDVIGLLSLYLLFPNRFLFRLMPAVLLTAGSIALYLFVKTNITPMIVAVTLICYALANFLGILVSARLYSARRKEFLSHIAEQAAQEKITRLAMQDDLTSIANRRNFYSQAEAEYAHFIRTRRPLSLLMIDIDHFKKVNDKYGHSIGDAVLVQFAEFVSSIVRQEDLFGRLGGEEFAVLLREASMEQAMEIGQRINEGTAKLIIPGCDATERYTVSIGIASGGGEDNSFDSLLDRADKALYVAKQKGRNRVVKG